MKRLANLLLFFPSTFEKNNLKRFKPTMNTGISCLLVENPLIGSWTVKTNFGQSLNITFGLFKVYYPTPKLWTRWALVGKNTTDYWGI